MELYKNNTWTDNINIYQKNLIAASEAAATFLTIFLNCLAFPKKYLAQDTFPLDAFLHQVFDIPVLRSVYR